MDYLTTRELQMTSIELSEITGKQHQHIMRDIRNEIDSLGEEFNASIFGLVDYTDAKGEKRPCYTFGREGAMQLALKYDAITRRKVIIKLEELENSLRPSGENLLALAVIEAHKLLERKDLVIKKQEQVIGELKPKADYVDFILQNKGLVTITQIAKDYGMSGTAMNDLLHRLKVQYKQSRQWLLYTKYQACGYTHSITTDFKHKDGTPDVTMNTKWTQKGRLFLYELLKENQVFPTIEKLAS